MDLKSILEAADGIHYVADLFEKVGTGRSLGLTQSMREVVDVEFITYLSYISMGNGRITDNQATLMNLLWSKKGQNNPPAFYETIVRKVTNFTPEVLTLQIAKVYDSCKITEGSTADLVISIYDAIGEIMIQLDDSYLCTYRKKEFINGMKNYLRK